MLWHRLGAATLPVFLVSCSGERPTFDKRTEEARPGNSAGGLDAGASSSEIGSSASTSAASVSSSVPAPGVSLTAEAPPSVSPGSVSPTVETPGSVSPTVEAPGSVSPTVEAPGSISPGPVSPASVSPASSGESGAVSPSVDPQPAGCGAGQTNCGNDCVNTLSSAEHCGACDKACGTDEVCNAGTCQTFCEVPLVECDGSCVNTDDDPEYCGGCETSCSVPTGGMATCNSGTCGISCNGTTACGDECIDTQASADHCGGCNRACDAGEVCDRGSCTTDCTSPLSACDGACVNLNTDPQHCGDCETSCAFPAGGMATCSGGDCGIVCTGTMLCGDECVDTETSSEHCGGCNRSCATGEICEEGMCQKDCASPLVACNDSCVNLSTDLTNCGQCGRACAAPSGGSATCSGGTCVVTTPPRVLTFSLQDGARGVRDDAVITVSFSEPMDEVSVEGSVSLTNHSGAELSFAWNANSTVLTITPGDLQYATGASANSYELVVESGARDAEGHELEEDADLSFTTLRRVSDTLFPGGASNLLRYTSTTFVLDPVACAPPSNDLVGLYSYRGSVGAHIMYVTFDLSSVVGTSLESAVFKAEQITPDTGFYPGGSVELAMIEPGSIMEYEVSDRDVEATIGTLASMANSAVSLDVTSALASTIAMNPEQQVFRLMHGAGSPEQLFAHFSCTGFALDVVSLEP